MTRVSKKIEPATAENKNELNEKIEAWKNKYGDIFEVKVEDKVCYLKKPDRKALSSASVIGKSDPLKYNEILLANCWLGGDEEIKTDDSYFLGISSKLAEIVEIKDAEIKKL